MRDWLKSARLERGLTTKKISEKIGISESYYSMIENGIRQQTLDFSLVIKLADVLGISLQGIAQLEKETNRNDGKRTLLQEHSEFGGSESRKQRENCRGAIRRNT